MKMYSRTKLKVKPKFYKNDSNNKNYSNIATINN